MKASEWLETPGPRLMRFQKAQRRRQTAHTYKQTAQAPSRPVAPPMRPEASPIEPSSVTSPETSEPIAWHHRARWTPPEGTLRAAIWLAFLVWLVSNHVR